jgi:hypothetical protein
MIIINAVTKITQFISCSSYVDMFIIFTEKVEMLKKFNYFYFSSDYTHISITFSTFHLLLNMKNLKGKGPMVSCLSFLFCHHFLYKSLANIWILCILWSFMLLKMPLSLFGGDLMQVLVQMAHMSLNILRHTGDTLFVLLSLAEHL